MPSTLFDFRSWSYGITFTTPTITMPLHLDNISCYNGPTQLGASDDLLQVITTFLDEARISLDIAVQEIDHPPIAEAIVRAHQRGLVVRLVIEQSYVLPSNRNQARRIDASIPNTRDSHEINRELLAMLFRAGVDLHVDFNKKIFHQKFIIRDRNSILTGSTNFTGTGVTKNLNHIVTIKNSYVAKQYQMEFDQVMEGRFGANSNFDLAAPKIFDVGNVPVTVLFAPDHAPEMVIMKQMLKAKESIKFAIFTFAESSGIDDTMKVLGGAGIKIRGVMDRGQSNMRWAASHGLVGKPNIELWLAGRFNHSTRGKLHHKLMVIDDRVVILGSFNYTGPANYINDENLLQIGSFTQPRNFNDQEWAEALIQQQRITQFFSDEIERIIEEGDTDLLAVP